MVIVHQYIQVIVQQDTSTNDNQLSFSICLLKIHRDMVIVHHIHLPINSFSVDTTIQ